MKIKQLARSLWDAIDPGGVDLHEDRMAMDALCSAVPPDMVGSLLGKESARATWDAIRTVRICDKRIRKSAVHQARREYDVLEFKAEENVEDFAIRLNALVSRLAVLGDPEPPHKVVEKYLRVAKPRFRQLVISIETLFDVSTLYVEEITGRLVAAEDDDSRPAQHQQQSGKLLLTEEE